MATKKALEKSPQLALRAFRVLRVTGQSSSPPSLLREILHIVPVPGIPSIVGCLQVLWTGEGRITEGETEVEGLSQNRKQQGAAEAAPPD